MKTTTLTLIQKGKEDGNGDVFIEIVAVGYDEKNAKQEALNAMMYACCSDFTTPSTCKSGTLVSFFKAEGVLISDKDDIDDVAESMGWDYAVEMEFNGDIYALSSNYQEYLEGGSYASSEINQYKNWEEVL